MNEPSSPHLLVIGGGIGGYTAAIRGARNGMRVTLVEQGALGGTCLNVGCIPTKSLLINARRGDDIAALAAARDAAVDRLVSGVTTLVRRNRINRITDQATFHGPRHVRLKGSGDDITADLVVVATGSVPNMPTLSGIDLPGVITSDDAAMITTVPDRIAILGGGVIGIEFAQVFADLGSTVTVLEQADCILPGEDADAVGILSGFLEKQGVTFLTHTRAQAINPTKKGLALAFTGPEGDGEINADLILVAAGRRPNTQALGCEHAKIALLNGAITTDSYQRTSAEGVYAVGDVCGDPLLAHRAAADAEVALSHAMGSPIVPTGARAMPRAVYTRPEIAAVGLTEAEARSMGAIKVGHFPFVANGRAVVGGLTDGFVKVIADAAHEQILGVIAVGPEASTLLGEATLAVQMEMTLPALMQVIHAHPTLSEALAEAVHDAHDGGAVHQPPRASR